MNTLAGAVAANAFRTDVVLKRHEGNTLSRSARGLHGILRLLCHHESERAAHAEGLQATPLPDYESEELHIAALALAEAVMLQLEAVASRD
ncbi:hypothetical protein [Chitinimonas lacunae]|uniref:Uncharacterized protein n=1 Tax=Chitinimonas lacunae TaxID=1963018 RepID=A0ABV8MKS1_9NEIS